jgi:hypothetical protein
MTLEACEVGNSATGTLWLCGKGFVSNCERKVPLNVAGPFASFGPVQLFKAMPL